jgi:Protein of unknown function (DUF3754)
LTNETGIRPETDDAPKTKGAAPDLSASPSEPYVALRKDELIDLLVSGAKLEEFVSVRFRKLCALIETVLHQEFHARQEHLKTVYAPFDPDSDTRPINRSSDRPRRVMIDDFLGSLSEILTAAHYHPLEREDLDYALSGATYWGLDLQINRSIFERLMIYVRGDRARSRVQRDISTYFRSRVVDLEIYERLVLVVKLRREFLAGDGVDTDNVYLKMFRDIPQLDLEMLLPGTRPRIRLLDAGKIGGSSVTGIFSLGKMALEYAFFGKLKWLMLAIGTLAYAAQSFLGYRRTKAAYVYSMTQQLYYQNLDNNAGVFCRLIDEAEDEETKETILAYFLLWTRASQDWTAQSLAEAVPNLLREHTGERYQFEARQAIAKLERLGLLTHNAGRLEAVDPGEGLRRLSNRWNAYLADEFAV